MERDFGIIKYTVATDERRWSRACARCEWVLSWIQGAISSAAIGLPHYH